MSFKLDEYIVDRIQYATAEDTDGKLLYVLTQLSDATINTTAQSTDATDATGTTVKRFWRSKNAEFSATSAFFNLAIAGAASGDGKKTQTVKDLDTADASVRAFARVIEAKAGETVDLTNGGLNKVVDGSIVVCALEKNGSLGDEMTMDTTAAVGKYSYANGKAVMPPAGKDAPTKYVIQYNRIPKEVVYTTNSSNKTPKTVHLLVKALGVDPCEPGETKSLYIDFPSFQVSPEINISLTTDGHMPYAGQAQQNYCSDTKELYTIFAVSGDNEETDGDED